LHAIGEVHTVTLVFFHLSLRCTKQSKLSARQQRERIKKYMAIPLRKDQPSSVKSNVLVCRQFRLLHKRGSQWQWYRQVIVPVCHCDCLRTE